LEETVDYVFHAASNTHPVAYATDPVGTITTNIIGTGNLLRFAAEHGARRMLFASSVEVYGENRGDVQTFTEDYCGYLNCNTLRAGYPESKRCGEALCQAYIKQCGLDVVIPRLARTYGPTMLMSDTKALSQFLKKGIAGEDIVLKSQGTQLFSYTYVADAVSAVLYCLLLGKCGEAYNIADSASDIRLRDLAAIIAEATGRKVVFDLPDETERAGYSTATVAVMESEKIRALGWNAQYTIRAGLERTIRILKEDRQ
jgi:nucleoside-diphosphate-sugar epimerase